MDNDSLVSQTQACSLTENLPGCDTSKKTGFLRLPLELRRKVYREVLGPCRTCGFQTSLLRVSKVIHDEALEIFYRENGFFMYHIHRKVSGQLRPNPLGEDRDFLPHHKVYPVTGADGRIGFEPALTVSIALQQSCSSEPISQSQDEWEKYVALPVTLLIFCKTVTMCKIRNSLHIRLDLPSVESGASMVNQDFLLDQFRDCRGVGTAEILAPGGLPIYPDLSSLMAKPLEHLDEILTRARTFHLGVRRVAGLRPSEALPLLVTANYFFEWWGGHGFELSNETDKKWNEFWDMSIETSLAGAFQSLQNGEPKKARQVASRIWDTRPLKRESAPVPRRLWDMESEGHYVMGLCSLAEGCKICGLYEFLQALIDKPGHETVDKEIDKMEAAIEDSENPVDEIVRWNIKYVLRRFRHQPLLDPNLDADDHKHRGPADMTVDDQYKLEDSFVQSFAHLAGCRLTRLPKR
ncbi:hypothetical protein JMJ35_010435 [Cladonia borealis]|uniref:Uncharacterized protein n=1 Tax=Cladonia borealis TaxID=184061 RepID=A0AA39QQQ6_9LECA|nr:hypothetical protein JMJ35_010435 [Cladonia borealis]